MKGLNDKMVSKTLYILITLSILLGVFGNQAYADVDERLKLIMYLHHQK